MMKAKKIQKNTINGIMTSKTSSKKESPQIKKILMPYSNFSDSTQMYLKIIISV
jgi:hypothetical protein